MDVLKSDCGGIACAGEYKFRDGHLIVTLYQIAIWTEHPDAIFTAAQSTRSSNIKLYILESWRMPERNLGYEAPASCANAAETSLR